MAFTPNFAVAGAFVLACSIGLAQEAVAPLSRSFEHALPLQSIPAGLTSISANECARCHTEISVEWAAANHAQAQTDLQYQFEWARSDHLFVCANCHTPLQNQQEMLVSGLIDGDIRRPLEVPNPAFDRALQNEGVTCAACHVRDGEIIGPYETTLAPHPVRVAPEELTASLCLGCHNAQARFDATLVCSFTTGDEWAASPYALQGTSCVTCHMPEARRSNVLGMPERDSNRHLFVGAGIPKLSTVPAPQDGFVSGLEVTVAPLHGTYRDGDTVAAAVTVHNTRAGHQVPTGDVERFVTLELAIVGPGGERLAERQERIGQLWEWWPEARLVSSNSLEPLESRRYEIAATSAGAELHVVVTNHRMTDANAVANGLDDEPYPLRVEVFRRVYTLGDP